MSTEAAIAGAQFAFNVMDKFGVFDSLKSPTETELRLQEISLKLDEIDQSIDEGVFDILDQGLKLQIVAAREDTNAAATALPDNALLPPAAKAAALANAVTGLNDMANAIDGVLAVSADISPELLDVMVNALTHSAVVLATAANVWSKGEFTGDGYNHGGLMGYKSTFDAGIETLQNLEDRLTAPGQFQFYDSDIREIDLVAFKQYVPSFKVAHSFASDVLAQRFFDAVIAELVPDAISLTYGDGFIEVILPVTRNENSAVVGLSNAQLNIGTSMDSAYYHFMTGLERPALPVYGSLDPFSWVGSDPKSLVDLINAEKALVDGTSDVLTGVGSGETLDGTAEADYLISGVAGDTLNGLDGDDYLQGNGGNDTLFGGEGDDVFAGGAGNDTIIDTGSGDDGDTVILEGSFFDWDFYLIDGQLNAIRGDLINPTERDILIGIESVKFDDAQAPILTIPAAGDDPEIEGLTITIVGSAGNDTFQVFDADTPILELADNGNDTVLSYINTYTLGDNFEQLVLAGDVSVTGIGNALDNAVVGNDRANALHGEAGNDSLTGLGGDDTLFGGDGNDWLDGGADADDMEGGDGDDIYYVDDAGDVVTEAAGEGYDSVVFVTAIDRSFYTLTDNVEALIQEDTIAPDAGGSTLNGNDLDNTIVGNNGDDFIYAGAGNDALFGGTENDFLFGSAGDDQLFGGDGFDLGVYFGDLGDFALSYVDETDTLTIAHTDVGDNVDQGTDTVQGVESFYFNADLLSKADLILEAERQANTAPGLATLLSGGTVNENAVAGTVVASLTALDLDGDFLTFTMTDSTGNAIDDDLFEIVGRDLQVKSGAVIDFEAQASSSIYVVVSDPYVSTAPAQIDIAVVDVAETIRLADGGVVMVDDGGAEARIIGGTGDDDITANRVGSVIDAKGGHDIVRGGVGGDIVTGGSGNDHVSGEAGADMLTGGTGADTIKGGIGGDTLDGSSGRDDLSGGSGADAIKGGAGDDAIGGGTGGDHLKGGTGNDVVKGGDGADLILGGSGNDKLSGGGKNDTLDGGSGKDILTGNKGADVFVFDDGDTKNAVSKRDVITDFDRGSDEIDLRLIDANKGRSGDQKFDFSGKSAEDNSVWFKVKGDDVVVMGDNTGDGVADFRITLLDLGNLGANDFLL